MMLQLNPTIPVEVLGKGEGYAVAVIDYSQEHDLLWVVFLDSREIWTAPNKDVRACKNWSMRRTPAPDYEPFIRYRRGELKVTETDL